MKIPKFYRNLKQQRERNCWWKISTVREGLPTPGLKRSLYHSKGMKMSANLTCCWFSKIQKYTVFWAKPSAWPDCRENETIEWLLNTWPEI